MCSLLVTSLVWAAESNAAQSKTDSSSLEGQQDRQTLPVRLTHTQQATQERACNTQQVKTPTGRLTVVFLLCGALLGAQDEATPHGEVDGGHTNHGHDAHDTTHPLHGCGGRDVCRQGALGFSRGGLRAEVGYSEPCIAAKGVGLYRQGNRHL